MARPHQQVFLEPQMKASSKPQLSTKWWASQKPAEIKGTDLETALEAAESALAAEKKKSDADSIDAACASLEQLESAVDKTIQKECDKKKHKDLIAALEKFDGLIQLGNQPPGRPKRGSARRRGRRG